MVGPVEDIVAENRRRIRKQNSRFVGVDVEKTRELSFGTNFVLIDVEATIYRRTTGSQIVVGHDAPEKGFGEGTFGNDTGEWVEVTDDPLQSTAFTRDGKSLIARLINNQIGGVALQEYGYDSTDAAVGDGALFEKADSNVSRYTQPETNTSRSESRYDAVSTIDTISNGIEVGLKNNDGVLLSRLTVQSQEVDPEDEVRVDVDLTVTADSQGDAVVTQKGESLIATAFDPETSVSIPIATIGEPVEGETLDKTSVSLNSEVVSVPATSESEYNSTRVEATVSPETVPDGTPSFEVGEVGFVSPDGDLVWGSGVRAFNYSDDDAFGVETAFRF